MRELFLVTGFRLEALTRSQIAASRTYPCSAALSRDLVSRNIGLLIAAPRVMYKVFCKSQRGVLAASELLEYLNFTGIGSASGGIGLQTHDRSLTLCGINDDQTDLYRDKE